MAEESNLNPRLTARFSVYGYDLQRPLVIPGFHLYGMFATGRIAHFLWHMALCCNSLKWSSHSKELRLALHPQKLYLHPVQLSDLG
jgi:hypothetical protein